MVRYANEYFDSGGGLRQVPAVLGTQMRVVLAILGATILVTSCGRRDAKLQQAVIGTWRQGEAHTLTFDLDGHYISIYPSPPSSTYEGRWHIERGLLILTQLTSNSVPVGDERIPVSVSGGRLVLGEGTSRTVHDR